MRIGDTQLFTLEPFDKLFLIKKKFKSVNHIPISTTISKTAKKHRKQNNSKIQILPPSDKEVLIDLMHELIILILKC